MYIRAAVNKHKDSLIMTDQTVIDGCNPVTVSHKIKTLLRTFSSFKQFIFYKNSECYDNNKFVFFHHFVSTHKNVMS